MIFSSIDSEQRKLKTKAYIPHNFLERQKSKVSAEIQKNIRKVMK